MANGVKFDAPPVVETALSVQFNSLPGFSGAHAGWFWKEYVEKLTDGPTNQWIHAADVPRLPEVFEKFGTEDIWVPPSVRFAPVTSVRTQLLRGDGERMIQVQDTRFVLNWRKAEGSYPSYQALLPEFRNMLHAFQSFCSEAGFGLPVYNVWEIVYVDHVRKGTMWDSARDLSRIFPGLSTPPVSVQHAPPSGDETVSADWRFSLANRRGRLYIQIRQVRIQPSNEEVIQLTTTARGPVNENQSWEQGLNFGHEAIRETFLAITSAEAQRYWEKRG
jgi:uncharacterized protein (TIGR04255 family)